MRRNDRIANARGRLHPPSPIRTGMKRRDAQSGAALIIALAILLVLLSLAITFMLIVRFETIMARQTFDRARAEHLLDGALAQAEYRLNRDLEMHSDALSLDHGWRSWFSGAAFVGKTWTRAFQGNKNSASLYHDRSGLVAVSIEQVEQVLRALPVTQPGGLLRNGLLYARFNQDNHIEPLFRGPRTEHWLHAPRDQGAAILLFATATDVSLVNHLGEVLSLSDMNNELRTSGRPEWFRRWTEADIQESKSRGENPYPFVTPAFFNENFNPADAGNSYGFAQEKVNLWADVDSNGDGIRDAIWMPLARDINHYGDGIDNDLDGVPDPMESPNPTLPLDRQVWSPKFEQAAFVYHGMGLPDAARKEDPDELAAIRDIPYNLRGRTGDGYDNNNSGVDHASQDKLFLTVPLPGLITQVDLNSDGIFDEKDYYPTDVTVVPRGPLFVRLPEVLYVPVLSGGGAEDRVPVTINDVDVLDNDYDLVVNSFRSYACVSPQSPPPYHPINVDRVLQNGRNSLNFFIMDQTGSLVNQTIDPAILATLVITCSGEAVSEIVGRYAVHITDEAAKANLNVAGGHVKKEQYEGKDKPPIELVRSLNEGITPFEYDTRLLPSIGSIVTPQLWTMRTGAEPPRYSYASGDLPIRYENDATSPGYGSVDDNGNALLLALSGRDDNGNGTIDDGLYVPTITSSTELMLQEGYSGTSQEDRRRILFDLKLNQDIFNSRSDEELRKLDIWPKLTYPLGAFEGVDEPSELRLYNPLKNYMAEADNNPSGQYSDKLLLRKEDMRRHAYILQGRWDYLQHITTVNSDTRQLHISLSLAGWSVSE